MICQWTGWTVTTQLHLLKCIWSIVEWGIRKNVLKLKFYIKIFIAYLGLNLVCEKLCLNSYLCIYVIYGHENT